MKSHGLTANATKQIVHSQEVFVSIPSERDEFSGHPQAAEYAKRLSLIPAEELRDHDNCSKFAWSVKLRR